MTLEMGKRINEARGEVVFSSNILAYYAKNAERFLAPVKLHPALGEAHMERSPIGLIFGVEPWNFPCYQLARVAGPHLVAGNVLMVKHAGCVPQCAGAFEKLWIEAGAPVGLIQQSAHQPLGATFEPSEDKTERSPRDRELVLLLKHFGGPEAFELVERPVPSAGSGEVRVRVLAASVQFTDIIMRKGRYPDLHQKPPLVLGYDVVGEIDEVGPGVTGFHVGDRVADLTMVGSYARYRTLRADGLVPVPPGVDPAEAVALVLSWATAYQLLHRQARVQRGQRVLVLGAAGAVGQALVALGNLVGLEIWGTARAEQADLVRSLGATPVDFETSSKRTLPAEGFDVVFDGIGQHGFRTSWGQVKRGGMLSAFGFSAAVKENASVLRMGLWLLRLHLWNWLPNRKAATFFSIMALRKRHPDWYRADLEALFQLLAEGVIHPRIAERIGLEGVPDAHRRIEAGGLTGKIVICPPTESYTPSEAARGNGSHTARGVGTLGSDRARRVIR